jgi:DNA-binding SARP family transcriptional activator/TolB-like protein/Tfp pilus assembly protein PilF
MLLVRFLGPIRLERAGAPLELPRSKKTRALLAYLVVSGREHSRERLCSMFWERPDDPRGGLRWSLSKIRKLVDEPGVARLVGGRDTVGFAHHGAEVDVLDHFALTGRGVAGAPTDALVAAAGRWRGEFLEGEELFECASYQSWLVAQREQALRAQGAILEALVDRLGAQPDAALPHARTLVELRPDREESWATLVRLLAAAGRRDEAEDQVDIGRRALEDAGAPARGALLLARRDLKNGARGEPERSTEAVPFSVPAAARIGRPDRPSLKVLPLRPASQDPATAAVADVLTEDLVTALSRDRTVAVVTDDRSHAPGAATLAGGPPPVHYVIDGSVRRLEDAFVIAIRLVDAHDGRHVWAERCAQPYDGIVSLDDACARRIAAALQSEVEQVEAAKARGSEIEQLDARASYFVGCREMYRFSLDGLGSAKAHFKNAIRLDPHFSSAYARLSYVHIQEYWYGTAAGRDAALESALSEACEAVALDPRNALGHLSLGRVYALRRDLDAAIHELETAVRLNPSLAQAYFALGQASSYAGQPGEATRLLETAIDLNPHDPHRWSFLHDQAEAFYALGDYNAAERAARAAARAPNATYWPWLTLAAVLSAANRPDDAEEARRELLRRRPAYDLSKATDDLAHFSDRAFVARYLDGLERALKR